MQHPKLALLITMFLNGCFVLFISEYIIQAKRQLQKKVLQVYLILSEAININIEF